MKELRGNLFDIECDALCITTNGFVKSNGECVMGKGCAKQVATMLPEVPRILGNILRSDGNHVHYLLTQNDVALLSYPVKPEVNSYMNSIDEVVSHMRNKFNIGDTVPGWACVADIEIIKRSAYELVKLVNTTDWSTVLIPRPGCGAGELSWDVVEPILSDILDDRFIAVTF